MKRERAELFKTETFLRLLDVVTFYVELKKMKTVNEIVVLGRIIPDSGKMHQNQEVYSIGGGICSLKATDYKNPPKILIVRAENE